MGYFKYIIKKILYFIPKRLLVFLIILLTLMLISNTALCATNENLTNYDVFNWLETRQHLACYQLMQSELGYYNRNAEFQTNFVTFCQNVTRVNYDYGFVYTYDMVNYLKKANGNGVDGGTNPGYVFFGTVLAYNTAQHNSPPAQDYDTYSDYPVNIWTGNTVYRISYSNGTYPTLSENNVTVSIPSGLENNFPQEFRDFVIQVANGTFDGSTTNDILQNIDTKIAQTNQKLADVESAIQDTNDFLNDDTTDDYSAEDLPSDSMQDITASGFNGIFTTLYNKFDDVSTVQTVNITIPYVNYPMTIRGDMLKTLLTNHGFSAVLNLISLVWYFVISRYILLDIYKYINQIKNGDIGHTDSNIKADML